jgi:hypothetical protein
VRLGDSANRCSPSSGVGVGEQAKGTGTARVMTTAAVVVQDRRNLPVEGDRSFGGADA